MKIIGLVGGTGWVSTVEYYRIINQETNRRRGRLQFAECVLYSLNFGDIVKLRDEGREKDICYVLCNAAKKVEKAGAHCIVICANTMHMFADAIQRELTIPIIHIAEATGAAIRKNGMGTVGLLGTKLTMERDFYTQKLAERGIATMVPETGDRDFIEATITKEILKGVLNPASRDRFLDIIRGLSARGVEGIVLGCTEIPLLVKQEHTNVPLFDTLTIHAHAAVDFAVGGD